METKPLPQSEMDSRSIIKGFFYLYLSGRLGEYRPNRSPIKIVGESGIPVRVDTDNIDDIDLMQPDEYQKQKAILKRITTEYVLIARLA
jgi:hypothetical protein